MADFSALVTIAGKLSTDIDAHLAADAVLKGQLDAANAKAADLTAQLAVFEGAQANIDAVAATLTAADDKVAPVVTPAPGTAPT